jgi:two-component system OmpR family sensor kinase
MSAIASRPLRVSAADLGGILSRFWIELVLAAWMALNLAAIVIVPQGETIPFHFVWVALSLAYCFRMWQLRTTIWALLAVCVGTGITLGVALTHATAAGFDEMAEVPLMGLMFVAMMWHVERRQAAEAEIRRLADNEHRLLERQRTMIRDASHQLRTPITVARGHAELVRANYAAGQLVGEDVDIILDELTRLSRISDRLLMLAAAEHPDFLRARPLDLEPFLMETARRWSAAAARRWEVSVEQPATLLADEERLGYSLDALLENAVKFTGEGDRISIGASGDNGYATIRVSDTGSGIPKEHLGRIFERFARVDERNDRRDGTGLGLAIVKAIVEAHGGDVQVASELGQGTTFELRLPCARTDRDTDRRRSSRPTSRAAGTTARRRADES